MSEKSPGELVTVVDQEAEEALSVELSAVAPGVPIVGEEGCSADPSRLAGLAAERAWVVDALDGTANFVAGLSDWAVMVALLASGKTVAAWIFQPVSDRMYVAVRSAGAWCDGRRLRSELREPRPEDLRGAVSTRFMDEDTAALVNRNSGAFGAIAPVRGSSGIEYPRLVEGQQDFVLFWRTLPWDHVPGVLLVQEAGGVARRPDRSEYQPGDDRTGLLAACDPMTWELAERLLQP